ncbi:MAG: DUF3558 domain-containing protein [Williamsia sp.]|nr:DUF3558 domain-containing protein [Williamsia sp.]
MSRVAVVVIGCVAMVAGCSTGGEPVATPSSSSQSVVGPGGTVTVPASANPYPVDKLWRMQNTLPKSRLSDEFGLSTLQPQCSALANAYLCSWSSKAQGTSGFGGLVTASTWSFDELKTRPNFSDFVPVTVGGQEGVRFRANGDSLDELCQIAWGTSFGVVWVSSTSVKAADNCTRAARFAEMVHEYAPK